MTQITPHEGVRVTADQLPAVAATLAAAFHDDPVFTWWIPDDARRREVVPAFFGVVADAYLRTGVVHATDDLAAVAVWGVPGAEEDEELNAALEAVTGEHAERFYEIAAPMAEQHPTDPHWYLWFVGTRPERQARGLGSAVVQPVLERCDLESMPAYLEATSARSAELYRRHGFEVVGEIAVPGGPSLWPMWRDPR